MNERVGGLASRIDCNGKGMNIGKSVTMNVGFAIQQDKRRKKKKQSRKGGGHVKSFLVRSVRFGSLGILVGWSSGKD